jgi:hypothetical protein
MVLDFPPARTALRLRIADVPGSLAEVAAGFAGHGIDIVRLEVIPDDGTTVLDDVEVTAPDPDAIVAAVDELRRLGVDVLVLPSSWSVRDWVSEVFDAIEALERASSADDELEALLGAANRHANTSQAVLLTEAGDGDAGRALARWRALEAMAAAHPAGSTRWWGASDAVARVGQALAATASSSPAGAAPGLSGLAIACDPAASTILAVAGDRPPFAPAEVARIDRFARLAVRLADFDLVATSGV